MDFFGLLSFSSGIVALVVSVLSISKGPAAPSFDMSMYGSSNSSLEFELINFVPAYRQLYVLMYLGLEPGSLSFFVGRSAAVLPQSMDQQKIRQLVLQLQV